mmetsp:Transcript_14810/g.30663  ORF Transcript_14810/g.30663 Transcript_14810/m.30663 type:complete len:233 (-) Transcript_14810:73-771(-)
MISTSRLFLPAVFLAVHALEASGFGMYASFPTARSPTLRSINGRPGRFTTQMLAMEPESQRQMLMMENEARHSIVNPKTQAAVESSIASKPHAVKAVVECLLVSVVLVRAVLGFLFDAVASVPNALLSFSKMAFSSKLVAEMQNQFTVVKTAAAELLFDIMEEIVFQFAYAYRFALAAWAAFTLRVETQTEKIQAKIDRLESRLEGYGYSMRRNSRRPSLTALAAQRVRNDQ